MNAKISVFVIWVEAIMYLLLFNLHDCTFNFRKQNLFTELQNVIDWNAMLLKIDCVFFEGNPRQSILQREAKNDSLKKNWFQMSNTTSSISEKLKENKNEI